MSFSESNHFSYNSNTSSISNSPSSSPSSSPTSNASNSSSISSSPNTRSPWAHHPATSEFESHHHLIGSLYREEGHVYSLAAAGDLLYTGSESKNVRVWRKDFQDFSEFKSKSGMVKAIVVVNGKIFTGHEDGKIRVWAFFDDKRSGYNQVGILPKTRHSLLKSLTPKNYVRERRKNLSAPVKHNDTVSCMSVDEEHGLVYSGSWDKTLKIWRISDSKCLESVQAHDDAVNSVVATADGMVFTGSADGTVKAWRREFVGRRKTQHSLVDVLLKQEHAVTAVAADDEGAVYAGSSDGLVRFWEVEKEEEKRSVVYGGVLRGHKMAVLCLVADGNLVMSGSADKSICVWRRGGDEVHECMAVLTGHGGPVKCLAAEKEEEEEEEGHRRWTVYSGSLDKSVKIWRVFE